MIERRVTVRVKDGLHARPAAQLAKLAKTFAAEVELRRGAGPGASARSSVKLILLGVKEGEAVLLRAEGADAPAAIEALSRFIETPDASPVGAAGVPASEGAAIGPAFGFFPEEIAAPDRSLAPDEVEGEVARLRQALEATVAALVEDRRTGPRPEDREIVEALIEVAHDAEFQQAIEARIRDASDAVTAVLAAGQSLASTLDGVEDDYIRSRAEDVRGIAQALARRLLGRPAADLGAAPAGCVLVAEAISAWDFARAPLKALAGIVCTRGARTSHVAIMARTHGIPAVLGAGTDVAALRRAATVALDGTTGEVWLDPDEGVLADVRRRIAAEAGEREALDAFRSLAPVTRDGHAVEVAANLGSLREIEPALAAGAMGVGLFRTELLFMERRTLPTEDEQAEIYGRLASAFAPRPVTVRTLDIGGDKPVAGVDFPHEDNPFLGWRGVRMCLDRPDVFKPQLKALLRAAVHGNVRIMVPMVTHVEEVLRVKTMLAECRSELEAAGVPFGAPDLGIMMETPAAALLAADLASHAAFFSIGTNDLTQYVMAADRLNPRVADLNRAEHPAVMKAVEMICAAARAKGIRVGVCGEAAARPDLMATYLRYGIGELSMSPPAIPRAKKTIRDLDLRHA